jgi:hypothetical protein
MWRLGEQARTAKLSLGRWTGIFPHNQKTALKCSFLDASDAVPRRARDCRRRGKKGLYSYAPKR